MFLISEKQMPAILDYIRAGKKIDAIKEFRTYYPCGLKEAKDAVEAIAAAILPKVEAPKKYIVLYRDSDYGDFDLTYCRDKAEAAQLASNLVTNSQDVIVATIVATSYTTRVMKDVA